MANIDEILSHYVAAALWTDTEDKDSDDIHPDTLTQMRDDVEAFMSSVDGEGWDTSAWSDAQMGHDFWLTRNGHGAGFWDRGHGKIGDDLTALAKPFGEFSLYIGDDDRVHGA
jgi:hypothetical protein